MNFDEIAKLLPAVAGKYPLLNASLHILVYATMLTVLLTRVKPKRLLFDGMIAAVVLSVSAVSIASGNPFNFITFLLLSFFAVLELFKGRTVIDRPRWNVRTVACLAVALFGLWYPHFVEANPAMMLLVSPLGALPCPTLTVVLALVNLYYPNVHKGFFTALTAFGLFYGITGVVMMKVYMDIPLMLAALYSAYNTILLYRKSGRPAEKSGLPENA